MQTERVLNQSPRIETSLVKQIGNVYFSEINFTDFPKGRNLIFAHPGQKMNELVAIDTIWNPDKSVAFYVYEYRK